MNAHNDGYIAQMREAYEANPGNVPQEWQEYFANEDKQKDTAAEPASSYDYKYQPVEELKQHAQQTNTPAATSASKEQSNIPANAKVMTGADKSLAKYMNNSLSVPTATSGRELDVTMLWDERSNLNNELKAQGRKLSFTHILAFALVQAAKKLPVMNHTHHADGDKMYRVANEHTNIGLAVDVPNKNGPSKLMVPIIHKADTLTFAEFIDKYDDLVDRARNNKLNIDDLTGATISLTNPGVVGTTFSVPRLMEGQACIIAVGSIHHPFGVDPKTPNLGRLMTMTSTYDHRVIQGAESGAYLREVQTMLNDKAFYQSLLAEFASDDKTSSDAPKEQVEIKEESSSKEDVAPLASEKEISVEMDQVLPVGQMPAGENAITQIATLEETAEEDPIVEEYHELQAAKITASTEELSTVAKAMSLVKAHRTHGHLAAKLDPLGSKPLGDPSLDKEHVGLTDEVMQTIPSEILRIAVPGDNLLESFPHLKERYCSRIAYQFEHVANHDQRVWLRKMIENGLHFRTQRPEEQKQLLERLTRVEVFETYLKRAYLGSKQFSIEGVDMLIPMLDRALSHAATHDMKKVVLGMAHRGRLNVLAHIIGKPYEQLMVEFEAENRLVKSKALPEGGTGDVKYHQGATGTYDTPHGPIDVSLSFNASHLEYVTPIVVGKARALQTRSEDKLIHDPGLVLPIIIHGDAAFPGQGVVGETLNMQNLNGYSIGGTVHIIANNQIGFTTDPNEARSTHYAADMAKGYDVPIIHVNADAPEECMAAMRLALAYRDKFGEDIVIDLIGYRRWGHNEGDEPTYTQPTLYEKIKSHARVRELLAKELTNKDMVSEQDVKAVYDNITKELDDIHDTVQAQEAVEDLGMQPLYELDQDVKLAPVTKVDEDVLKDLNRQLHTMPQDFKMHSKLARQLADREKGLESGKIRWAHAESLALASLLTEGVGVRLTGQDSERGTFSHRHLVLHDEITNHKYAPIQNLTNAKAHLQVHNSPLSEAAAVGFEYGYSTTKLNDLVLWEAQFGDFINSAQVYIDQFLAAGLAKWGQTTRLTFLLPHGYEGNGPEHSSGRLERFLQLSAEGNMRVANVTTPAQYFHLLRRQAMIERARPLIIMTPKGLLRNPMAVSTIEELSSGEFKRCLTDPNRSNNDAVKRLVLCSGKAYYELINHDLYKNNDSIAVIRLEMLAPFPTKQIEAIFASYPNAKEIVWMQEEPENMGAYHYVERNLRKMDYQVRYAGRPMRASVSEGYHAAHGIEQARILKEALG